MISAPLLIVLSLGALSVSLALLLARLQLPLAADLLAIGGALFGLLAVLMAAVSSARRVGQLSTRSRRR